MKALTQEEIRTFVDLANTQLKGAQLQDILVNDRGLALGFRRQIHYWLILDLVPNSPAVLLFAEKCPFKKGAKSKPVSLFLNSHGKNLLWDRVDLLEQWGRVLKISLRSSQKLCELEVRLIPRQCNLAVTADGKCVYWEKPLELKAPPVIENPPPPRPWEQIQQEWLQEQGAVKKSSLDPEAQWLKQREKDLEKKRRALKEIQKQIESEGESLWYETGEWLKSHGSLQVPEKLRSSIDVGQSLSWNIENCFKKAKHLVGKKEGVQQRRDLLLQEIEKLERSSYSPKAMGKPPDLMAKSEARGRKLHLESGAIAYCGKSAADNLALLRQAKAWDFWLHLKDYPGAHAIVHRQRDQLISDKELFIVAEWLVKESLGSKALSLGQKLAVVVVETRFVRPIKGDKLGRVTYHSERTLHFTSRQS